MAKKKEIKEKEIPLQTALQGNVVIKKVKGSKVIGKQVIHNEATIYLLYGMMISLSGKPDLDKLPNYLAVGTGQTTGSIIGNSKLEAEITGSRVPLTPNYRGNPEKDLTKGICSTVYQGLITYNKITTFKVKELGIYGTYTGNSLLARVQLTSPIELDIGQSLVVEWSFSIKNVTSSITATNTATV